MSSPYHSDDDDLLKTQELDTPLQFRDREDNQSFHAPIDDTEFDRSLSQQFGGYNSNHFTPSVSSQSEFHDHGYDDHKELNFENPEDYDDLNANLPEHACR